MARKVGVSNPTKPRAQSTVEKYKEGRKKAIEAGKARRKQQKKKDKLRKY